MSVVSLAGCRGGSLFCMLNVSTFFCVYRQFLPCFLILLMPHQGVQLVFNFQTHLSPRNRYPSSLFPSHQQIFQPLLMKYFTYDELREIRGNVLHQHNLFMSHDDWEEKSDGEVECQGIHTLLFPFF